MVDVVEAGQTKSSGTSVIFSRARFSADFWVAAVGLLCVAQIALWTLAPALSNDAPPLDVVESGAWGPEWLISSYKHPALPSWCLEAARLIPGVSGWTAYLVPQLFVSSTFLLVFFLGRGPLGDQRAVAGTLLLSGIYYFNWRTPEFNHDIAQLPLWAGVALALWRAVETNRARWWTLLGVFAAASLYAKLASSVLLIAAASWILWDKEARRRLAGPGPWLALLLFLIGTLPLANWLLAHGFAPASYAVSRGQGNSHSAIGFLLAQLIVALPVAMMLRWAGLLSSARHLSLGPTAAVRRFGWYLGCMTLAPMVIAMLICAAAGTGLRTMWGVPMLNLVGLMAILLTSANFGRLALQRIAQMAACLLLVLPGVYAAQTFLSPTVLGHVKRENWPQALIATRMHELWVQATGKPLGIVAGDETNWVAGLIALGCCEKPPSLFTNGDGSLSPWITKERLAREGVLVVWQDQGPSEHLSRLIANAGRGVARFPIPRAPAAAPIEIHYAIVPPQSSTDHRSSAATVETATAERLDDRQQPCRDWCTQPWSSSGTREACRLAPRALAGAGIHAAPSTLDEISTDCP